MLLWGMEDRQPQAPLVTRGAKVSHLSPSVPSSLCSGFGSIWLLTDPPQQVVGVIALHPLFFQVLRCQDCCSGLDLEAKRSRSNSPSKVSVQKHTSISHSTPLPGKLSLSCASCTISLGHYSTHPPPGREQGEEMNFALCIRIREKAAARASPSMRSERKCHEEVKESRLCCHRLCLSQAKHSWGKNPKPSNPVNLDPKQSEQFYSRAIDFHLMFLNTTVINLKKVLILKIQAP